MTSTPIATATDLCVAVSAQTSSVNSGQNAYFSITVHPEGNTADDVTVQIQADSSASSPAVGKPVFTVCGSGDGTQACPLGTMPLGQTTQLQGKIAIPGSAPTGDTFTLTATVTGAAPKASTDGSVTGSASVSAVKPTPSPTPTPTKTTHHHHTGSGHHSSGGGGGGNSGSGNGGNGGTTETTNPLAGLPPLSTSGNTNPLLGTSSSNPGGLFPTINPSSGASTLPSTGTGRPAQRPYKATTVADVLPLNTGQLSAQVAGLIVLGLGIILVFARISLRRPKGSESK